jgi:hypothetical protein
MGYSKEIFMQDREEEFFGTEKTETGIFNAYEKISDKFVIDAQNYEDGNLSALEVALKMRKDVESLETQMNLRKTWIDENKVEIDNEATKYPEGYKGYKIILQSRTTLSFKNIDGWKALDASKKEFEAKSKLALQMIQKGIPNVDAETGEEIPLPEVSVTSFIKFEKVK